MIRVESSPERGSVGDAFPKYTTSIPARRSRRVPTLASPARPLALRTSTASAGPRSPGMVFAGVPPPHAQRIRTAAAANRTVIASWPAYSRKPRLRPATAIPNATPNRGDGGRLPAALLHARWGRDRRGSRDRYRPSRDDAPVRGSRRDTV